MLQAVTQIQEMTLTFIPKVFAVGLTMVLLGPWMLDTMLAFTIEVYKQIPAMTGGLSGRVAARRVRRRPDRHVLPRARARRRALHAGARSSPSQPCRCACGSASRPRPRWSRCPPSSDAASSSTRSRSGPSSLEQLVIGSALAFGVAAVFAAVEMAGSLVDLSIGFSLAQVINPTLNTSSTALAQVYSLVATMVFLVDRRATR